MGLFALGLLLPLQSYFIAQSQLFTQLAITDTRLALIIPYAAMGLSLAVYLLKVYLDALPDELFDAARIDGAGDGRVFWHLALPLLRPGLATVAIFSALAAWNEFLLALLYIQDDALKTIPTGLLSFSSRYVTDYSLLFSALSIVTLPMIVIYVAFNRQIVEGITAGSVK
jgi:raffinose/stachyose/melibiose transport system permease protein